MFNKEPKEYTFWDYQQGSLQRNKGLRIDHYLVSDSMIQDLKTRIETLRKYIAPMVSEFYPEFANRIWGV